jgi:hypothetical protein
MLRRPLAIANAGARTGFRRHVIVGGNDATNVVRNVAAVRKAALDTAHTAPFQNKYAAHGNDWRGLAQ